MSPARISAVIFSHANEKRIILIITILLFTSEKNPDFLGDELINAVEIGNYSETERLLQMSGAYEIHLQMFILTGNIRI
jgi:hypothetical protein